MAEQARDDWQIIQHVAAVIRRDFGQNRFPDHSPTDIAVSAYRRLLNISQFASCDDAIEDAEDLARFLTRIAKNRALTLTQRSTASPLDEEPAVSMVNDEILVNLRAFNAQIQDERTRQVVSCKMNGLALAEIAAELNISESTVGRIWLSYRDQLRKALE